ncbi:uncharacterized protein LOC127835317 [Dreissena polymorpha]|uniref:Uncharacterized protein n=1 Tax=Dreissena polymorpha TaxID=45954 RepID=A0A9D4G5V6_DREPO|nr:uncharacterized protein LOC127835317 [Dreissena polymorpha]KAH3810792.1 hypothetical protein DPMN_139190 [Dreissena polymorpha]
MGRGHACALCLLTVLCTVPLVHARYGSITKQMPACYSNSRRWGSETECQHPRYTSCGVGDKHICCSPYHYCCKVNKTWRACCRKTWWTGFEITSITCGIVSWVIVFVVAGLMVYRSPRQLCTRNQVAPSTTRAT